MSERKTREPYHCGFLTKVYKEDYIKQQNSVLKLNGQAQTYSSKEVLDNDGGGCCQCVNYSHDVVVSEWAHIPVKWVDEEILDKWLSLINLAGFLCTREENIENSVFMSIADKEPMYRIRIDSADTKYGYEALATYTCIRYLFSPYWNGLVKGALELFNYVPEITPLEAIILAHYSVSVKDVPKGYQGDSSIWFYGPHGLLHKSYIYKIPDNLSKVFTSNSGINQAFADQGKYFPNSSVYDSKSVKDNTDLKHKLEVLQKDCMWNELADELNKLRVKPKVLEYA